MAEIRNEKITIKCTRSERDQIEKQASENNMSLSEYIRQRLIVDVATESDSTSTKILKSLSICTAFAQTFASNKFNDKELQEYDEEVERIMRKNCVDGDLKEVENMTENQ